MYFISFKDLSLYILTFFYTLFPNSLVKIFCFNQISMYMLAQSYVILNQSYVILNQILYEIMYL